MVVILVRQHGTIDSIDTSGKLQQIRIGSCIAISEVNNVEGVVIRCAVSITCIRYGEHMTIHFSISSDLTSFRLLKIIFDLISMLVSQ
jgi:hypothetical protein